MSKYSIGHAKSDHPQLIEKIKVLQLIEQQMHYQNQQAQKILHRGLIEEEEDWLEEEEQGNNLQDEVAYATTAALIVELKTIYSKITTL
jgi:hypothetical protein